MVQSSEHRADRPGAPVPLKPAETLQFDPAVLESLCDAHGGFAEEVIAGALFRIEERVILAVWQADNGELSGLRRTCQSLETLAREVGMVTMRDAAAGLLDALPRREDPAFGACLARLRRLAAPGTFTAARLNGGHNYA